MMCKEIGRYVEDGCLQLIMALVKLVLRTYCDHVRFGRWKEGR